MKITFARTACAALLLSFVPAAALAAGPVSPHPAIATGLAVPLNSGLPRGAQVPAQGRFLLVDAASARLYMIEDGRIRDSMRVIVGKPSAATPSLSSTIYYATLNPYWNVPVDLAQTIIAPRVLKEGAAYLRKHGYEVVSHFGPDATAIAADKVDWKAVATGRVTVYVRQRPGAGNSMGQVKFGFHNDKGIYLHDTPKKQLFDEVERNLSNGCVRLEDAPRLARWLLGRDPIAEGSQPEQHVLLPQPVRIAITYLDPQAQTQLAALR